MTNGLSVSDTEDFSRSDIELIKRRSLELLREYKGGAITLPGKNAENEVSAWEQLTGGLSVLSNISRERLQPDEDLDHKKVVLAALAWVNPNSPRHIDPPTILRNTDTAKTILDAIKNDSELAQALSNVESIVFTRAIKQAAETSTPDPDALTEEIKQLTGESRKSQRFIG